MKLSVACNSFGPSSRRVISLNLETMELTMYEVSCRHVDTCLGCYLTDHHTREGECLLGITPSGQTEDEAIDELYDELNAADHGIPDDLTREQIRTAMKEAVSGVDFRAIDENGNRTDEEAEYDDEAPQVWFVLSWEKVSA